MKFIEPFLPEEPWVSSPLFESYHQSTLALIANTAANIDAIFANKIMIDWFIKDPNKLAKTITDIHHHSIEQQNKSIKRGNL